MIQSCIGGPLSSRLLFFGAQIQPQERTRRRLDPSSHEGLVLSVAAVLNLRDQSQRPRQRRANGRRACFREPRGVYNRPLSLRPGLTAAPLLLLRPFSNLQRTSRRPNQTASLGHPRRLMRASYVFAAWLLQL